MISVRIVAICCALVCTNYGMWPNQQSGFGVRNRGAQILTNAFSNRNPQYAFQRRQQGNILTNGNGIRTGYLTRNSNLAAGNQYRNIQGNFRHQNLQSRQNRYTGRGNQQQNFIQPQPFNRYHQARGKHQANILLASSMLRLMQFINKYRSNVDASNMLEMKWSNTLAIQAAARSSTCQFSHISDTQGEILNIIPPEYLNDNMVDFVIKDWIAEKNQYRYGIDCRATRPSSCSYSQMVWATSREVGCASHWCAKNQLLVCLFNQPGNAPGMLPYVKGNHCARCLNGCHDQLCLW